MLPKNILEQFQLISKEIGESINRIAISVDGEPTRIILCRGANPRCRSHRSTNRKEIDDGELKSLMTRVNSRKVKIKSLAEKYKSDAAVLIKMFDALSKKIPKKIRTTVNIYREWGRGVEEIWPISAESELHGGRVIVVIRSAANMFRHGLGYIDDGNVELKSKWASPSAFFNAFDKIEGIEALTKTLANPKLFNNSRED